MVVREPWAFFVSMYYYAGARKCGGCTFAEFLRINPNAQSHMAVGNYPRHYSAELLARHASHDPQLRSQLEQVLDRVDLLGTTEELDAFVYLLCERAGIAVCPRGGVANIRDAASARGLRRKVLQLHMSSNATKASDGTERMQPLPNASSPTHRRAVDAAGWLDAHMYARAKRSLALAVETGGATAAAARRRAIAEWRALPPDESTGCLTFDRASESEARKVIAASMARRPHAENSITPPAEEMRRHGSPSGASLKTLIQGAGGTVEGMGLRYANFSGPSDAQRAAVGATRATREAMQSAARCFSLRREAADLRRRLEGWGFGIPPSMRPVLLDPWPGRAAGGAMPLAAMCSTKPKAGLVGNPARC